MRDGARDYLTKPFVMGEFLARLELLIGPPETEANRCSVCRSRCGRLEHFLRRAAASSSNLLLTGETGVGKEVCARFLHALRAKAAPARSWPSTARRIPADLLESELFGHERVPSPVRTRVTSVTPSAPGRASCFSTRSASLRRSCRRSCLRLIESRSFHRVGGEQPIAIQGAARLRDQRRPDVAALPPAAFRDDLLLPDQRARAARPAAARARRRHRVADRPVLCRVRAHDRERCRRRFGAAPTRRRASTAGRATCASCSNRIERAVALAAGRWIMPGDLFPERLRPCGRDKPVHRVARHGAGGRREAPHPARARA